MNCSSLSLSPYNEKHPDLTISGNVTIGRNVTLKGTVIIIAVEGSSIHIPDGSILENKLCSGNFSIIDH
jgi:UTP--glucose-1-phosphate uridylyltransferase